MSAESFIVTVVGVLVVVYAFVALAAYLRKRGTPLIVPETEPGEGPVESLLRQNGQARVQPGAAAPVATAPTAPAGTRTGDLLRRWFAGKSCTICERPIPPIQRIEQHPGLMSPSRDLVSWEEFARDERLPQMLESHLPVCANCVMAETFRRQYPDLVVDRSEHGRHSPSVH